MLAMSQSYTTALCLRCFICSLSLVHFSSDATILILLIILLKPHSEGRMDSAVLDSPA